jgi:CO/xanthine dehydrogenase FAD-binding subunit
MRTTPDLLILKDIREVLGILAEDRGSVAPVAGGTDLIPGFHQEAKRFSGIKTLIDINHLSELKKIRITNSGACIGAAVTFAEILGHQKLATYYPLLLKAASTIGSVQIRNRATIAGNFVNNAPCADSIPPLLVYDAKIRIRSKSKERVISLSEFLIKPYRTQLEPDELVSEIRLPVVPKGYTGDFYKLGRRRGVAISRITLAVLLRTESERIKDVRLASGAVTPIGKRFYELENVLVGENISPKSLKTISIEFGKAILQETGWRWSSPYKLPVVQQLVYQIMRKLTA